MFGNKNQANTGRAQIEKVDAPTDEPGRTYVYDNGQRYSIANGAKPELRDGRVYVNGQPLS